MDRALPRSAPRDAVGQRWLSVLAFQAVLSVAASALHLAASPCGRRHPLLGIPTGLLLTLHPFLACAGTELFVLALLLTVSPHPRPPPLLRRALATALFAAAGTLCMGSAAAMLPEDAGWEAVARLGFRGAVAGAIYAVHYFLHWRWLLEFPVVQLPLLCALKTGLLPSGEKAVKLYIQSVVYSHILGFFLPWQFHSAGSQILTEISILVVTVAVGFCWELNYQFVQIVHTRRCSFVPPQSAANVETNPTEFILESLEQSDPLSLIQYLAYQDLCVVSECNLEPWRSAAFFEKSGETYKRIVTACLKPLEEFTLKIAEALEGLSSYKPELMLQQSKLFSAFDDSQICTWCARTLAGLTVRSRQEDQYGVGELTGCNAAAMTTLLSALVAVIHSLGPENRTGVAIASTQKGGLHKKAYIMADVLQTSIYQIVSAFIEDLRDNANTSSLVKNWISEGRKPVYGSQAVLVQKLILFIEYRAV